MMHRILSVIRYLTKGMHKRLYRRAYKFRDAITKVDATMRSQIDKSSFMLELTNTISNILGSQYVHLICAKDNMMFDNTNFKDAREVYSDLVLKTLHTNTRVIHFAKHSKVPAPLVAMHFRNAVEVTVPIISDNKVLAILNIGQRTNGKTYSNKDLLLLSITADYAGAVLKNIQLHEKEKTYSARLEEQVQQRTKELQDLQRAQKQSMLDISHGLQGPLTLLRAELEHAQSSSGDSLYTRLTDLVDKVSSLAYELVTMARLNTAQPQSEVALVHITSLVSQNMITLSKTAEHYNVKLSYNVEPDIHIQGTAGDIQRVLLNLVKNALKYTAITNKDEKTVNVSLTTNRTNNMATLIVSDNGIGIPQSALSNIFDTFYRVDDTTSVDGAGIGLTIVKRIVEAHNGTIDVKSTVGSGTTFTVSLPTTLLPT